MSNDKTEATWHGGDLPQRDPWATFAAHGAPPDEPHPHAETSPGPAPWASRVERDLAVQHGWSEPGEGRSMADAWRLANPVARLAVLAAIAVAVLIGAGVALQRSDSLPVGVPLIGKDTGVAACETIAGGQKPGTGEEGKATVADFQKARAAFADSRYPAIRDNGVKLMDLAGQISVMGEDPGLAALPILGSFTDAYAGLSGGCAEHGYTIPPLATK